MKLLTAGLLFIATIFVSAIAYQQIALAQGTGTLTQLQQFVSTTSPSSAITQATYGKLLKITGLATGLCLTLDANNLLTTTSCGGGGSGSGTVSTSTPLVSGQVDFSTGVSTIGNDSSFLFDTATKKHTFTFGSTTALSATTLCLGTDCRQTWPTSSGGTGSVGTSSLETAGFLAYWNTTSGYPAKLDKVATTSLGVTGPITFSGTLGAQVGGSGGSFGCATCLTANQSITLSGAVTGSGATAITTAFGSLGAGVLGTPVTGVPTAQATSTLYGVGTGGMVLGYSGGNLLPLATTTFTGSGPISLTYASGQVTGSCATCNTSNATVSSITAGLGLNGGTITTAGTLSLISYLATSTAETQGQLAYWSTTAGTPAKLTSVATTTVTCGSGLTCTTFTTIGGSPITLTASGGSGTSPWATTTSSVSGQLDVYTLNNTDIVTIGGNSTTTARFTLDPNTCLDNPCTGIGTTSPWGKYSIGFHNLSPLTPSFVIASSSLLLATTTQFIIINGNVGIATSSPGSILAIQNVANFVASGISTIYNGLNVLVSLIIPSATTPSLSTTGAIAVNTTAASSSVEYYDGAGTRALYPTGFGALPYASSTLSYMGAYSGQAATYAEFGTGSASTTVKCSTTGALSSVNTAVNNRVNLFLAIGNSSGTTTILQGNPPRNITIMDVYCKMDASSSPNIISVTPEIRQEP